MKGSSEPLRKVRARLAACFAISNLGHSVPGHAASNPQYWSTDPVNEVEKLAGHLMESRQHERIFREEAQMWHTYVSTHTRAELLRVHGPISPWLVDVMGAIERL